MPTQPDELQQSLAAATNYINAARLILGGVSDAAITTVLHHLEQAEEQLLRAGEAARHLRDP